MNIISFLTYLFLTSLHSNHHSQYIQVLVIRFEEISHTENRMCKTGK